VSLVFMGPSGLVLERELSRMIAMELGAK
jgi:hypothetical protein